MTNASLAQWLERLETLHPNAMDLGLERVSIVAERMGLIPATVPVITVAGTNGKGSTVAVLEAVLGEAGRVAGVCSSPHFIRFNERIRVAGAEVDDDTIVAAFGQIEQARAEISLTYFEFATVAALWVFRELDVDLMILEVGLGGALDAVNIVDATVAVITSIALDHQQWLGDTRESIAVEKAGIFRPYRSAVIAEPDPPESMLAIARDLELDARYLGRDFYLEESAEQGSLGRWKGTLRQPDGSARILPEMAVGALLPANACAALQALLEIGEAFTDVQLASAMSKLHLPGRRDCQEVAGRSYILDVAHNPAAVDKLVEYIDLSDCNGRTIALFSIMEDKDILGVVQACSGRFDAWFLADQAKNGRAADARSVASILREEGVEMISISKNIKQALRRAQGLMSSGDTLVVFGSFFTVAAVMPLLEKERRKETQ